jgi:hypothetical protein
MLDKYLIEKGIVTGPLERNTSYSGLEVLRRNLLGEPQMEAGADFFLFGTALHEVFLENKFEAYNQLPVWQQRKVDEMVEKLHAHPVVQKLMEGAIKEDKQYKKLNGVLIAYILDAKQPKLSRGSDLKTTTATTHYDCLKKAITYGYPKQGNIYVRMEKLKEFYFIFICKSAPYDIFISSYKEFKEYIPYAEKESEFLTYFYSQYGRFVTPEDKIQ